MPYVVSVQVVLAKLLLLVSALLMPFGMASASASVPVANHHAMTAGKSMEHCPDQPGKERHQDRLMTCSMACASALPAQQPAADEAAQSHRGLVTPVPSRSLRGVLPEIATPPPKLS